MSKPISLALFVIGIVLLVLGVIASDSFSSDVSRLFTGEPTDKSIWMILGGVVAIFASAGGLRRRS